MSYGFWLVYVVLRSFYLILFSWSPNKDIFLLFFYINIVWTNLPWSDLSWWSSRWNLGRLVWLGRFYYFYFIYIYIYIYIYIWIPQQTLNALWVTVLGMENISPVRLILKKMTLNWTWLQCVIVAEDFTVCEVYVFIRHAGANNVIPLSENVNWMMRLKIWTTSTAFRIPLLSYNTSEKFLAS